MERYSRKRHVVPFQVQRNSGKWHLLVPLLFRPPQCLVDVVAIVIVTTGVILDVVFTRRIVFTLLAIAVAMVVVVVTVVVDATPSSTTSTSSFLSSRSTSTNGAAVMNAAPYGAAEASPRTRVVVGLAHDHRGGEADRAPLQRPEELRALGGRHPRQAAVQPRIRT